MNESKKEKEPIYVIYSDRERFWKAEVVEQEDSVNFEKIEELSNKHYTAELINHYKNRGMIKNCANLITKKIYRGRFFYPVCKENSLNWEKIDNNNSVLIGCPKLFIQNSRSIFI